MFHPGVARFARLSLALLIVAAPAQLTAATNSDPKALTSPNVPAHGHWAYQPIAKPTFPAVRNARWLQSDLDRFILASIEEAGLRPAQDAEPQVLARRIYQDLTGLPPTPEELNEFISAARRNRAHAVAGLVDRLLASPRFGEHWGRHWLDVVRFGESVTLRGFIFHEAWRYRDYVIDAFNEDRPFDEFAREQIAGDLLPSAEQPLAVRQRRLIATTFLALGNTNLEEQDKNQLDLDVVDEQLDTLGKAFLGQTLGCARCHDHKFDPIPTRDYYAMAGILRNARLLKHANVSEWLETPLPLSPEEEATFRRHESELAALEAELKSTRDALKARDGSGSSESQRPGIVAPSELPGLVVDSSRARAVGDWKHSTYSGRYVGDGYWHDQNQGKGTKTLSFAPEHLAAGHHEVRLAFVPSDNRATNVPVTIFHADGETRVLVNQQLPPEFDGRFATLGRYRFEANGFANVLVGTEDTRGYVTADAVQFLPLDGAAGRIAAGQLAKQTSAPKVAPPADRSAPAPEQGRIAALETRLREMRAAGPHRPMVMTVRETETPGDGTIQVRGSAQTPGALVPRGFLSVTAKDAMSPVIPARQSGRRELADWLTDPRQPLTARVYVNRVWGWLLGAGLVRSVDNFGTTGDTPTHPALLDHLASRFVAEGWSTKRLIREIMLSRTYQMAGGQSAKDPDNRRLSHAIRKRLTAEQLRDAMLFVSGSLDLTPPRGPTFPRERTADYGFIADSNQRSVYLPVFRNALPEIFEAFDFAPTSMVTGHRATSIVPTQALFLMNHPLVRGQAARAARRLLAARSPASSESDAERLQRAWQLTLGRRPTSTEIALTRQHLTSGEAGDAEAGWTEIFHALFSHAEFRSFE